MNLWQNINIPEPKFLIIGLLLACTIAGLAYKVRSLSVSGAIAAIVVGFFVFAWGHVAGATAMLLFFITSSILSRVGKKEKQAIVTYEKGDRRDAAQVIANGGVAVICIAWIAIDWLGTAPIAAFLGAIATANADTWATELGTLLGPRFKQKPIVLATLYDGEPGQSGAVSVPGTIAALLGALLIGVTAPLWGNARFPNTIFSVTVGGLAGSLFDSLLGGSLQVQYRDQVTGELTERTHASNGAENPIDRGLPWMTNDVVNFLSTAVGAAIAAIIP